MCSIVSSRHLGICLLYSKCTEFTCTQQSKDNVRTIIANYIFQLLCLQFLELPFLAFLYEVCQWFKTSMCILRILTLEMHMLLLGEWLTK